MTSDLPSESSSDKGTLVPCHGERFNCLESSKYSSHWQGQKTRLGSPSIRIGHARRNAEAEAPENALRAVFAPPPPPLSPRDFSRLASCGALQQQAERPGSEPGPGPRPPRKRAVERPRAAFNSVPTGRLLRSSKCPGKMSWKPLWRILTPTCLQ